MFSPSVSDLVALVACIIAGLSYKQSRAAAQATQAAAQAAREAADHAIKPLLRIEVVQIRPPEGNSVALRVRNYGQGPAIIEIVKIIERGQYESQLTSVPWDTLGYYVERRILRLNLLNPKDIILPGQCVDVFQIALDGLDAPDYDRALKDMGLQTLIVYYADARGIKGEVRRG